MLTVCIKEGLATTGTTRSRMTWWMRVFLGRSHEVMSSMIFLQWLWEQSLDSEGFDCIDCPVKNVFPGERTGKVAEDNEMNERFVHSVIR